MDTLKKVLIVDDSEPLQQIYKVTLKRYKCAIITALHREEGLKKLEENPDVNLILIDLKMPTPRQSKTRCQCSPVKNEANNRKGPRIAWVPLILTFFFSGSNSRIDFGSILP